MEILLYHKNWRNLDNLWHFWLILVLICHLHLKVDSYRYYSDHQWLVCFHIRDISSFHSACNKGELTKYEVIINYISNICIFLLLNSFSNQISPPLYHHYLLKTECNFILHLFFSLLIFLLHYYLIEIQSLLKSLINLSIIL